MKVVAALSVVFVLGSLLALAALVGGALTAYASFAKDLPSPGTIVTREVAQSTKILDRKGRLLFEIFDPSLGRRTSVPLDQISPYLIQATIATEDATFYENQGVNIRGILRAAWSNLTHGDLGQGGSSITQQLVKNVLIPEEERPKVSYTRKLKEVILSLELTRRLSKDQILQYYLNEINYGNLSYGIESAAQSYFGKSARELNLPEAAMLAGLPQAPAAYSPLINPDRAGQRQHLVLDLMVRQGFITQAEADAAKTVKLEYQSRAMTFDIKAPHFVAYMQELLEEKYGTRLLYRGGLQVTTTLDLDLQELGEQIVKEHVAVTSQTINAYNAALVAIDPRSGEILTMVGSADYFDTSIDGQVNIATAERQPGSSFKPFTYVTAFMKGYTPATMLVDYPKTFRDYGSPNPVYTPDNFNFKHAGPVSVREALANSMNIPAVRTIEFTGVEDVIETAHKMGITTLNRKGWYGLSLTLGGGEVKLLDMTYAYGVFANQGKMAGTPVLSEKQQPGLRTLDPVAILEIRGPDGNVFEKFDGPQEKQIITPQLAYLITNILTDNVARAPVFGNTLVMPDGRPAAIKTGTTEDLKDFWQMGYTPELAVGVWMGNSKGEKLTGGFSSTTAGPIWKDFTVQALADTPIGLFTRPPGIVNATVCVPSGLLPTPECQKTRGEIFIQGQVPTEKDNLYKKVRVDRATGLLASKDTPSNQVEEKVFLVLPEEARAWAKENNIEQPPEQVSPSPPPASLQPALTLPALTAPAPNSLIQGTLTLRGSAGGPGVDRFTVDIGAGLQPKQWISIVPPRKDLVENQVLGRYETGTLADGLYTLRLTVIYTNREPYVTWVPITVDNTKPSVRMIAPDPDTVLVPQGGQGNLLWIGAETSDASGIARVEYYMDGVKVGVVEREPYHFPYSIPASLTPGAHSLYVIAVDKTGNTAQSPARTVQVKG